MIDIEYITRVEPLESDYPVEDNPELVYLRPEASDLRFEVEEYLNDNIPRFFKLINGATGSGKTLTVSYVLYNYIKEHPNMKNCFVYINMEDQTPKKILQAICDRYGYGSTTNKTFGEILEMITKGIQRRGQKIIIILDEVDKFIAKSKDSQKLILIKSLNRIKTKPRPSIILIASDRKLFSKLGTEVNSTLNEVIFPAYNARDLNEILRLRAKHCLNENIYDGDDINRITKKVYQDPVAGGNRANARRAIDVLKHSACLASKNQNRLADNIDKAVDVVNIQECKQILGRYSKHQIYLILAFHALSIKRAKGLMGYQEDSISLQTLKTKYDEYLISNGLSPIHRKTLHAYLNELITDGMVVRIHASKYQFIEDPRIINEVLQNFIEEPIEATIN